MKNSSSENWVEIGVKEIILLYTASKNIFTNSEDFFPHKFKMNKSDLKKYSCLTRVRPIGRNYYIYRESTSLNNIF